MILSQIINTEFTRSSDLIVGIENVYTFLLGNLLPLFRSNREHSFYSAFKWILPEISKIRSSSSPIKSFQPNLIPKSQPRHNLIVHAYLYKKEGFLYKPTHCQNHRTIKKHNARMYLYLLRRSALESHLGLYMGLQVWRLTHKFGHQFNPKA